MTKRDREHAGGGRPKRKDGRRSAAPATPPDPRRDRILTAAEQLFAERGYERVTVRDVGETAGVTHPLIYYYWGSKRGLLAAVLERKQQRVRSLAAQGTDPRDTVLTIIRDQLAEGRLYLLIMARSFLGGMPVADWPGGYPGVEAAVRAMLEAGPADDPAWDDKAREVVSLITAMLCGWVLMGEQIMDAAGVALERREASAERLLTSIDGILRQTLAPAESAGA